MKRVLALLLLIPLVSAAQVGGEDKFCVPISGAEGGSDIGIQRVEICPADMPPGVQIAAGGVAAGLVGGSFSLAWLAKLRWLPAMGMFTRIRGDKLLDHPRRRALHELVEAEPGIHHQGLIDRTGMAKGQASHHLSMLVRANLLTTVRRKGFATYFIPGRIDAPVMQGMAAIKSATAVSTLRIISQRPGLGKRPLAREVGCSEGSLRYHVKRFVEAGLVQEDGMVISELGSQVIALLPEEIGQPKRPPGPDT